ncbi:glycosyltransferase family 2 protein, partial [Clostridium sp. AL.422]|uniref:glycosyltransferase family 2 protein n=1 Tax=Clostridium TaxID=1485 RepID=UPI00293DD529
MAKISVIVPVYNSEKCLGRCIDSILNQTYSDFELILINDGSNDKSLDIIKKYEALDRRVKVIDNKNNGVSKTRNIGITLAKGDYIQFIDSDDFIDKDMLSYEVNMLESNKADMVMTGLFLDIESKNNIDTSIQTFENNISRGEKDIAENLIKRLNGTYINSPVNKLYKKEIIIDNNIFMNEDIDLGEDLAFNLDYMKHCNSIVFSEKSFYHYCMRNEDNLTSKFREDKLDIMEILYNKCREFLIYCNSEKYLINELNSIFIKWMYYCFIDLNSKG